MAKTRIQVVEDERIVAKDLQVTLQALGYEVVAVTATAEEAIERAVAERPDLLLMDIVLQGEIDGIEASRRIRERLDVPIVYLTAYADDKMLLRALATEPFGYLVKPFEERSLATAIAMALYKHGMEKKLRESEEWLATTLRSIGDAVIATGNDGRVRLMNEVAVALTGWSEADAVGRDLHDVFRIINEATRAVTESPVTRALREGVVVGLANHTVLIARDGAERIIADSAAPIRDARGTVAGVVLVFRDVTEKRRTEEQLRSAQRLESLGVLAGGIAHDFNNLLTGILANLSLAKMHATPGSVVHERMEESEQASLRAANLTQQLLTFARGGEPVKRPIAVTQLIEESVDFALRGTSVRGALSVAEDLWPIEADPGQIGQVMTNLLVNACQAMPEGGTVEVRARNLALAASGPLPLPGGQFVEISVVDRGIGIPRHQLGRIFDPYFTTKQKGSGLGLAVCHSIVKRHDGLILVDSELGVGTRFQVYLPATAKGISEPRTAAERLPAGTGRILVMDDQEIIRRVVANALADLGYEAEVAADGAQAIARYREARDTGRPFAAVILDLTVSGGMGGKDAVQALRELDPEVRAIVSSGYSNDPILADHRRHGFQAAIAKPYSIPALAEVLRKVIGGTR